MSQHTKPSKTGLGNDLGERITAALQQENWATELRKILQNEPLLKNKENTTADLLASLEHKIEEIRHLEGNFPDTDERKQKISDLERNIIKGARQLENGDTRTTKDSSTRQTKNSALKEPLPRREAIKKGLGLVAAASFGGSLIWQPDAVTAPLKSINDNIEENITPIIKSKTGLDPLLTIDSAATGYFGFKVKDLVNGGEINQKDYYTATAFLAARCLVGGEDVTHHTMEELKFGFESAAFAVVGGFAAEGVSAQMPDILQAINKEGKAATRAETVASIVTASSVVSKGAMTIGSCSAFGDEVRALATDSGHFNKEALGIMMAHLGDHSALGAGFYSDPPDIPMAKMVGLEKMAQLKFAYGEAPHLYSLYSSIYKTNFALNEHLGQDRRAQSLRETWHGLKYALPVMPHFIGHSLRNLSLYTFQQPQGTKGATFDVAHRLSEAAHNLYEIFMHHNPDCIKVFSESHAPMSEMVAAHAHNITSYAQGKFDSRGQAIEEILKSQSNAQNSQSVQKIIELGKSMIAPETAPETSRNILQAIYDQIDNELAVYNQEKADQLKAHAHGLWLTSHLIHRTKDHPIDNVLSLVKRLTEKARLADGFNHGQMDVITLLPWQILLSVPISNVLKSGLESVTDSNAPYFATTLANMGLTGAVTATVDNLAAFLAASNAANKAGQPRLMEALMASIVFGSGTWAGNPIAHSKIAASSTHPAFGIPESIDVTFRKRAHNDVYGVTMGWTMAMNQLNMEEKILGDAHPMYKYRSNDAAHHAAVDMERRGFFTRFAPSFNV